MTARVIDFRLNDAFHRAAERRMREEDGDGLVARLVIDGVQMAVVPLDSYEDLKRVVLDMGRKIMSAYTDGALLDIAFTIEPGLPKEEPEQLVAAEVVDVSVIRNQRS